MADNIQRKLYKETGKMPSMTTVHIDLRACLLMMLNTAGVSNVRKDLVAKYSWMSRWLHVPAHYFVFTGESVLPRPQYLFVFFILDSWRSWERFFIFMWLIVSFKTRVVYGRGTSFESVGVHLGTLEPHVTYRSRLVIVTPSFRRLVMEASWA